MELLLVTAAFIIGFIFTNLMVPPIVKVAKAKNLFDPHGGRKIHTKVIPSLGGIAIFIGFLLSSIIATDGLSFDALKYIIAAITMMFFIGLKDDLMDISARKKFVVQIFAAVVLISLGNLRFTNLHGILGIHEINYSISIIVSIVAIVALVNAFNLIDGIDGLASGIAILGGSVLGIRFYMAGNPQFAIMSFALAGSLSGFFIYNVWGNKNKIFMGDTGSLIVGMVISALVIKFNQINIPASAAVISTTPVFSLAIVIVPLIDMLRVMTVRMSQGKSPFTADNNHLHHRLLILFPKHLTVTLVIISGNILILVLALLLNMSQLNINIQFFLVFMAGMFLSYLPSVVIKMDKNKRSTYRGLRLGNSFNSLF